MRKSKNVSPVQELTKISSPIFIKEESIQPKSIKQEVNIDVNNELKKEIRHDIKIDVMTDLRSDASNDVRNDGSKNVKNELKDNKCDCECEGNNAIIKELREQISELNEHFES